MLKIAGKCPVLSQRVTGPIGPATQGDEIGQFAAILMVLEASQTTADYSPGHTMRCCTPAMMCPKGTAMSQNRVRRAAIERQTCLPFIFNFLPLLTCLITYYTLYLLNVYIYIYFHDVITDLNLV